MKIFCLILLLPSLLSMASIVDGVQLKDKKVEKGVLLENARINDVRIFRSEANQEFNADLSSVESRITNFHEKCNNQYRRKRKHLDRNTDCLYFNKNLIESYVIKNIKKNYAPEKNEVHRWVIKRLAYNQGTYRHNDLLIIKKFKNNQNQNVTTITHTMIDEEHAKKYIEEPFDGNSPFDYIKGEYTITQLGQNKTHVKYVYISKTDHFILNKDLVVDQIYSNMAEGNSLNIKTIADGLKNLKINNKVSLNSQGDQILKQ